MLDGAFSGTRVWLECLAGWHESVFRAGVSYDADTADSALGLLSNRPQDRSGFLVRTLCRRMPRFLAEPTLAVLAVHLGMRAFCFCVSARAVRAMSWAPGVVGGSRAAFAATLGSSVAAFTAAFG